MSGPRYGCVAGCRADMDAGLHSPECRVPPTGGLAGLLNQATPDESPDPSSHGGHPYTTSERVFGYGTPLDPRFPERAEAFRRLHALAPETTAWAIKAAADLRQWVESHGEAEEGICGTCDHTRALLAEFDQLNQKAAL